MTISTSLGRLATPLAFAMTLIKADVVVKYNVLVHRHLGDAVDIALRVWPYGSQLGCAHCSRLGRGLRVSVKVLVLLLRDHFRLPVIKL